MKLFVLLIMFLFISQTSFAKQTYTPTLPTTLKADQINGDQEENTIEAIGNVELNKNGNHLLSDRILYNKNSQNIDVFGNIKIYNYDIGNLFAETASVKTDLKSGNFINSTIVFNDGSYIKSPKIIKINEWETIFTNPTFSICPNDEIKDNNLEAGKNKDIISITSKQTTIDKSTNSVYSKNSIIKLYGVPVLYIPYLKAPIPDSKRKSGFLHPSYLRTSKLGNGIKIPYYFNIAPDKDLTTTLISYVNSNFMLNNQYRQILENGKYDINLELATNKEVNNNSLVGSTESNQSIRWLLKSEGKILLPKDFELDFNIDYLGDKNYLRDYKNQFDGYTTSEIDLNYIKEEEYASLKTVKIQELEVNEDEKEQPTALPIFNYYTEKKPENSWFDQTYSLLTNSTVITRNSGLEYRRLSLKPEVKVPYNIDGNLLELSSSVQSDLYNINNYQNVANNNYKNTTTNYHPEASAKWSLPMIMKDQNKTLILEPLATFAVSSYKVANNKIANEDSSDTELTQSNLFLTDRLTGFDRSESGKRMTYGFKSSLFNQKIGQINLSLGQSWRKGSKTQDVVINGFNNNNKSNLVGELSYKAPKILSIFYNFQLNESSYKNDINEIGVNLDLKRVRISNNYILIRRTSTNQEKKEQINTVMDFHLTKNLWLEALVTNDLVTNKKILSKYSLNYSDCCINYGIFFTANNPSLLNKVDKSYGFTFKIKNF